MTHSKYEAIIVDNQAEFKNKKRGRAVTTYIRDKGKTKAIQLTLDNGERKEYSYAKISAEHFIPNPNNEPIVAHKDFNPLNCNLDNLFWTNEEAEIERYLENMPSIIQHIRNEYNVPNDIELKPHPTEKRAVCGDNGDVYTIYSYRAETLHPEFNKSALSNDGHGYLRVSIGMTSYPAHRLIAQTFLPNPENKPQVNHKNGIKDDNRVENLEWATSLENVTHAIETGLTKQRGEDSPNTSLTNEQVIAICRDIVAGLPTITLTKKYDTSESVVGGIRARKSWKNITESPEFKDVIFPIKDTPEHISADTVKDICRLIVKGLWNIQISKQLNVTISVVGGIRARKSWREITESDEFRDSIFPRHAYTVSEDEVLIDACRDIIAGLPNKVIAEKHELGIGVIKSLRNRSANSEITESDEFRDVVFPITEVSAPIDEDVVIAICRDLVSGLKNSEISKRHDVSSDIIKHIRSRSTWSNVTGNAEFKGKSFTATVPKALPMTSETAVLICRAIVAGDRDNVIASEYNTTKAAVVGIRRRRNWKEITENDEFKDEVFPSFSAAPLNDETVLEISDMLDRGMSRSDVIKHYNENTTVRLNKSLVGKIARKVTYTHLWTKELRVA